MKIEIIDNIIYPRYSSYKTLSSSLTIFVGQTTNTINILNAFEERTWILKNEENIVIDQGIVEVKLNTFESFVNLINLNINKIYVFSIINVINGISYRNEAIISTYNTMKVINEKYSFVGENFISFGNINLKNNGKNVYNAKFVESWNFSKSIGNGVIKNKQTGKAYLYVPNEIYTKNRNIIEYFYIPFTLSAEYRIKIIQVPNIIKIATTTYSINPPTKVCIYYSDDKIFISKGKIAEINVKNLPKFDKGTILIKPIYD